MQYRTFNKTGEKISLLGIGTMRLPVNPDNTINRPEAIKMIRSAIDIGGVNYVDTAYKYHDGESELVVRDALSDGYREKVFLADKMPAWLARTEEEMQNIFYEQLEKLGTDYIDFYLLHNVTKPIFKIAQKHKTVEFLLKMKEEGKIKHLGFSFHDDYEFFEEVVNAYPWEFCQIQLNYMDKDFQAGVKGLKYAASKGLQVIIMEPLKGGKLTDIIPPEVEALWNTSEIKRTPAEWAFKWVADFPEVLTVLSGMSSLQQIYANCEIMDSIMPNSLSNKDRELIEKVSDTYNKMIPYSCTNCRYCLPCPQKLGIPTLIDLYNQSSIYGNTPSVRLSYSWNTPRTASKCVGCNECKNRCPQHLPIPEIMQKTATVFGI